MRSRKPDEAADEERMKFRELYCDAAIEHAPGDPESLAILFVLARKYADWNTGERCWPSDEELAKYARCSERTVRRRRDLLENLGWFETWKEHGKGICYRLIIPEPNTTPTGHRVQSHRTQSPVTPDTESTNSSSHRTQSPDPLDTESGGHRSQSPANKNQENKNQETKEEEGVVQGLIDGASNIDGDPPPPPDLILEHQGTPLAARAGILPAEEETPTVKDSEPEDPDVRWKKPWKENLEPRADRMRTIYSSAELRKIWELGMDVYPTLWGYKVGDDELVAKWLVYKVGDLVSRKVKTGSWYKSLVDIEECSAWCAKNSNAAPSFVPTSGSHTPTAEELEERKRSRHAAIMADWNEKKAREAASEGGES